MQEVIPDLWENRVFEIRSACATMGKRHFREQTVLYFLIALSMLILCLLLGSLYAFLRGSTRRDRTDLFRSSSVAPSGRFAYKEQLQAGIDWFESQPTQELHIKSLDGLTLAAELMEAENPVGLVVAVHGFRSWPSREFGLIARHLCEQGYTVLYPYMRAHRKSEGKYITFGVKERYDIAAWAQILSDLHPDLPLFLYGQSMGGATVIMAAGLPLPPNTRGVIADSAYFSPADVVGTALKRAYKMPVSPIIDLMSIWAVLLAGYSYTGVSCESALNATSLPFLFIHGTNDQLVPYEMGRKNYEICHTEKELFTIPGAAHCAGFYWAREEYLSKLDAFLKKYLVRPCIMNGNTVECSEQF